MNTIRLKNYRCLDDTGEVEIKRLNFFLGANSSGKSSVLKFIPLIRQSLGIKRNGTFLWYGEDVDFNNFKNVVKEGSENIEVSFFIKNFQIPKRGLNRSENSVDLRVTLILKGAERGFDFLEKIIFNYYDQKIEFVHNERRGASKIIVNGEDQDSNFDTVLFNETNSLLPRCLFIKDHQADDESPMWSKQKFSDMCDSRFVPYRKVLRTLYFGTKSDTADYLIDQLSTEDSKLDVNRVWLNNLYLTHHVNNIIDGINIYFLNLANHITYVGPLRATAQRYYRFQNYSVEQIDSDGKNLAMYLYNLDASELADYNNWVGRLFRFNVNLLAQEGNVEIMIQEHGKSNRNMVDVGFGYSQILPIITMIWKAFRDLTNDNPFNESLKVPHIFAIEQPELHLHPRMQGQFADMLVKIINDSISQSLDIRFVIETHSEVIINRIGESIALKEFNKDNVCVYLFNAANEGLSKYVEASTFTEDGQLINWPYGFFSDYVFDNRD